MGRKRTPMSESKKNIISMLFEEYNIERAEDIENALKFLLGGTIEEMLESEMDEHLGYKEYERSETRIPGTAIKRRRCTANTERPRLQYHRTGTAPSRRKS